MQYNLIEEASSVALRFILEKKAPTLPSVGCDASSSVPCFPVTELSTLMERLKAAEEEGNNTDISNSAPITRIQLSAALQRYLEKKGKN